MSEEETIIQELVDQLGDDDGDIWTDAEQQLVAIGPPAVPFLVRLYDEQQIDSEKAYYLSFVMAEIGDPSAIEPMLKAYDWLDAFQPKILHKISLFRPADVFNTAVRLLEDESISDDVRFYCALVLGKIDDEYAYQWLKQNLNHPNQAVRHGSISALGEILEHNSAASPAEIIEHLLRLAHDPDNEVRWRAINSIYSILQNHAVPGELKTPLAEQLLEKLSDPEAMVRKFALGALAAGHFQEAESALNVQVKKENDPQVLRSIQRALENLNQNRKTGNEES